MAAPCLPLRMTQVKEAVIQTIAQARVQIAIAESLTGGQLSSALAAGPEASEWFRGGVVAYAPDVKFDVLEVLPGPVVSERCAREMALGVCSLFRAEVGVGVTGVGGPGPEDGVPAGTVFVAVHTENRVITREWHFEGSPDDVLAATVDSTLELLAECVS
jgi:nicotinamide-nucleotide amidase